MTGFHKFALAVVAVVGTHDLFKPFFEKMGWVKVEKDGDKMSFEAKTTQEADASINGSEIPNDNS